MDGRKRMEDVKLEIEDSGWREKVDSTET